MHADDFRLDRYGVVSGLRDGGYSDDMTLAAISGINLLTFSVQPHSVGIGALILADYVFHQSSVSFLVTMHYC